MEGFGVSEVFRALGFEGVFEDFKIFGVWALRFWV